MATVAISDLGDGSVIKAVWTLTSGDATGDALQDFPAHADRCITATGTWGGATFAAEGSNDATTWLPVTNASTGTAISISANGIAQIMEGAMAVRPRLSTVGAGATITVTVIARRQTPMRT